MHNGGKRKAGNRSDNMSAEEIFHEAIEINDPQKRAVYLDQACQGNPELRLEVEALLRADDRAGSFLEAPAGNASVTLDKPPSIDGPGTTIGRYELLELLGEGGMGLVYLAEQKEPVRRKVAFKIIKPGMDSKQVIARFEAERQALAVLDHPNIAHVFDAGCTETGRPYFVMEHVKGLSITRYCDEHKLTIEQRLRLFERVCEGVQHAHQKGIIHRDLKPSNILVTMQGDKPVPKIIDFGIAKAITQPLSGATILTYQGQLLGTPEYMSPEQVDFATQDIDTRSDIYSLGLVLYELLAGVLPFESKSFAKAGLAEIQQTIREQEPASPSIRLTSLGEKAKAIAASRGTQVVPLARRLHRELEWIPLKAMRKDRCRRYRSASEMADDIHNYLTGRPLLAGPETALYRVQKFIRKHAGSVATVALVATAVVLGLVISTVMYFEAENAREKETAARARAEQAERTAQQQRDLAERRAEEYRRAVYVTNLSMAKDALKEGDLERARKSLESCPEDLRRWEWSYLWYVCDQLKGPLVGHDDRINSIAVSPDGRYLVSGSDDETVRIWDLATGGEAKVLGRHEGRVYSVAYSPDGTRVASHGEDEVVKIWDVQSHSEVMTLRHHADYISRVSFSPDGKLIASGSYDGTVKLWDAITGQEQKALRGPDTWLYATAFSPDGRYVAAAATDDTIRIWDVAAGAESMVLRGDEFAVMAISFSPDGTRLASGSFDGTVRLWNTNTGDELRAWRGHTGTVNLTVSAVTSIPFVVTSIAFAADGRRLVAGYQDGTMKVLDAGAGTEIATLGGHSAAVRSVVWRRDDQIVSAGDDGAIKIWDSVVSRKFFALPRQTSEVLATAASPDGTRVASFRHLAIELWDVASGKEIGTLCPLHEYASCLAFSPDGRRIASGGSDDNVVIWDAIAGGRIMTLMGHAADISSVAFSPDGKRLASGSADNEIRIWDVITGTQVAILSGPIDSLIRHRYRPVTRIVFSPDGRRVVSAGADGTIRVWDTATTQQVITMRGHTSVILGLAMSPDGKWIASCGYDHTIRFWDASTGTESKVLRGQDGRVWSVAFSPDGERIVSTSDFGGVTVWEFPSGNELIRLEGPASKFTSAAFSSDGKTIYAGGPDGIVLWESAKPAGGYNARQTVQLAADLVYDLRKKLLFYYDVAAQLQTDSAISEPVRMEATRIAKTHSWEDAATLLGQSWPVVRSSEPNASAYEAALAKAEKANDLLPNYWGALGVLGTAKYRCGDYENSVTTLAHSIGMRASIYREPDVRTMAFMAMALHELGRIDDARAVLGRLRSMYETCPHENIARSGLRTPGDLAIIAEAERLLAGENSRLRSLWDLVQESDPDLDAAARIVTAVRESSDAGDGELSEGANGAGKLLATMYYNRSIEHWRETGDYGAVINDCEVALRMDPNRADILSHLAWLKATCPEDRFRNGARAIGLAKRACELTGWRVHEHLSVLAAACSEVGDFGEAAKLQRQAIDLLEDNERPPWQADYEARLQVYRSGRAYLAGGRWSFSAGEMVAWWTCDEIRNGRIEDASSNGLDGTIVGDADIVIDPERGHVLKLDGKGYVDCGNRPAFDISGSITIAAWLKVGVFDKDIHTILGKGDSAWSLHCERDIVDDSRLTQFSCSGVEGATDTDLRWQGVEGAADINDGKWHHVAGVYDGRQLRLYLDGGLEAAEPTWGELGRNDFPVCIGENAQRPGHQWNGLIDDVRIYSYALSPQEVKMLYEGKEPPRERRSE
jgi:WD40 repeat protein/serine/threonine protein kinase/tetratricopeptide (TPR) repeat protein